MVQVDSLPPAYRGIVRNSSHEVASDAPIDKGGGEMGFGAHELLEASLAGVPQHGRAHACGSERNSARSRFDVGHVELARCTDIEIRIFGGSHRTDDRRV